MAISVVSKTFNYLQNDIELSKNKGLILLYHRVGPWIDDVNRLCVSPQKFRDQLLFLKENFRILAVTDFLKGIQSKTLEEGSILITFDDGYFDNFKYALPILEELEIPALFFISTSPIEQQSFFWWDQLYLALKFERESDPLTLESRYFELHSHLKKKSEADRILFIQELMERSSKNILSEFNDYRPMTLEELKTFSQSSSVTIGAHTDTHTVLSSETRELQHRQIADSKNKLEAWLDKSILDFSYPFGAIEDYNEDSLMLCKELGFRAVFANHYSAIRNGMSEWNLPRALVRNWGKNEFAEKIEEYFQKNRLNLFHRIRYEFKKRYLNYSKRIPQFSIQEKPQRESPLTISIINTHDSVGGAAKVAFQQAVLLREHYDVRMFVSYKDTDEDWVIEIPRNLGEEARIEKMIAQEQGWQDLGNKEFSFVINHPFFQKSSHVILHNLHGGYVDIRYLNAICNGRRVFWNLHDMQALTGRCAHSFSCRGYEKGCRPCEHLEYEPTASRDFAGEMFDIKKDVYRSSQFEVIVPSLWLRRKLEVSPLFKDKKTSLVKNMIDRKSFFKIDKKNARSLLGLPQDKKIVLFCANGGLRNYFKGGDVALEVAKILKEYTFVSVGGETSTRSENWIHVTKVTDNKIMNLIYNASDVLFVPSRAENSPLVIHEALSVGLPVVASEVGGIPELLIQGENGFLFSEGDVKGACDALKRAEAWSFRMKTYSSENQILDLLKSDS